LELPIRQTDLSGRLHDPGARPARGQGGASAEGSHLALEQQRRRQFILIAERYWVVLGSLPVAQPADRLAKACGGQGPEQSPGGAREEGAVRRQRASGRTEDDPGRDVGGVEKRGQRKGGDALPWQARRDRPGGLTSPPDRRGDTGERRPHLPDSKGDRGRTVPAAAEVTYTVCTSFMATQTIALLVQAAGTILLFVVLLLLYRKFRRPAFLDWIASWGFFLVATGLLPAVRDSLEQPEARQIPLFALNVAMLTHVFFLIRGVQRFRSERGASRPVEM